MNLFDRSRLRARASGAWLLALAASCANPNGSDEPAPSASAAALTAAEPDGGTTDPGGDDAAERDRWKRAYYGGSASFHYLTRKARVALHESAVNTELAQAGTDPQWANLGPFAGASAPSADAQSADAGRLTAIVAHPTDPHTLYIATSGGVFKSTNADETSSADWTWTALTDNLPASSSVGNVSVGDLAMSPSDPNTLYLALGDPLETQSIGFFVTHDGGATWTSGGALGQATSTWKILPLDATTLLVATSRGMFRSTDGGASFTEVALGVLSGTMTYNRVESIARFADGTLAASRYGDDGTGHVYYSTDAGATWTLSTVTGSPSAAFERITVTAAASGATGYLLAAAADGTGQLIPGVFKTTDSGRTFAYVTPSGSSFDLGQSYYNQLLAVDPDDASHLWVGAQLGLYRSLDGGVTWSAASDYVSYMHADFHVATWSKTGTKTLYIGNDGGLVVMSDPLRATLPTTLDYSYADTRRNRGIASHLIYNLSSTTAPLAADARYRVSIGLQDLGARLRRDAGAGLASSGLWDEVQGGDGFGTLYHPYLPDWVLVSENGGLGRSTDNGANISGTSPGTLLFGVNVIADPSDVSGNGVLTLGPSAVYRSHDFGATFAALSTNGWDPNFYAWGTAAARTDANTLAVVGDFTTGNAPGYVTTDGGASWTRMGAIDANAHPRYVWIDPTNASVLYVSCSAFSTTTHHLWKSTDRGASFVALDSATNGLPYTLPIYLVKTDPQSSQTVYAATDIGVYRSTDGGATWARYGIGLPLVAVRDLWLPPDGSVLRVATYGRGVWELPLGRTPNTLTATITSPTADQTVDSGATLSFSGASTDSNTGATITNLWLFGDGTSATGTTASHTFTNTTGQDATYTVAFIATDASGGNAGATRQVTVHPQPDFSLSVSNGLCPPPPRICNGTAFTAPQGGSVSGTVNVYLVAGPPETVNLSVVSGLPSGATLTFNPAAVGTGSGGTLTFSVGAATPAGVYHVTMQGQGVASTHTVGLTLTVTATNPVANGGFETGTLASWTSAGTASVGGSAHSGSYAAVVGSTSATNGDSSLSQTFAAPAAGGTLSFWYLVHCPDSVSYDWATATLKDNTAGTTATILSHTCTNNGTWAQVTRALVAGHSYTLKLISHDDNYSGDPTYTQYDDVTVQ